MIMLLMTFPFSELDVCFVGVPIDSGTSNRPGTRFGPRQIRTESTFVRQYNVATGNSCTSTLFYDIFKIAFYFPV